MQVAKISAEKAASLIGQEYTSGGLFNPVQDRNSNWIITLEEAVALDPSEYEVIEWIPPIYDDEDEN